MDGRRSNLIAIDTRTNTVQQLLETVPDYGNIARAVASIDSTACRATRNDGETCFWVPGKDPVPAEPVGGEILLWGNGRALVMDPDKTAVCEIVLGG
ncbi:MAG: hypothetical protein GY789_24470 [Hyphomicrobiales bacterium]|nr:hypothetical protein [Hyphomicrobiales bacterium]MCP5001437.1 hypothetical protein [Hyphomicrobiales bacterium]